MEKNKTKKRFMKIAILIILLIIFEQATKLYAIKYTKEAEQIIIPNVLSFSYLENTGIAFGLAQNESNILIIASNVLVIGLILKFVIKQHNKIDSKTMTLLSFAISGGLSNLIDRIFRGYVVDFINLLIIPSYPRCNVADVFLVVSWFLLVFILIFKAKEEMKVERKVGEQGK